MFSRSFFGRSALRTIPRVLPKSTPPPVFRQPPSLRNLPRYRSQWENPRNPPPSRPTGRIVHYRYDPEASKHAKPLITSEQLYRAIRSPTFFWIGAIASGGAVVFYVINLEQVPVSGRWRFNCFSEAIVEKEGEIMYRKVMEDVKDAILPSWDPRSKMVERVMNRLVPANGLEHVKWEVHVIHSPEKNAFVIPGGKVFVYSGIIPVAKTDDGLAAILGHEIAHNLAQHAAESMSSMFMIYTPLRWALIFADATGLTMGIGRLLGEYVLELGIARPASRKQESEADYIGLMMMAKSCYNPVAAVGLWERMEALSEHDGPEWLSTHPSNANRIERIQAWLPKAEEARSESGCAVTLGYSKEFNDAFTRLGGFTGYLQ